MPPTIYEADAFSSIVKAMTVMKFAADHVAGEGFRPLVVVDSNRLCLIFDPRGLAIEDDMSPTAPVEPSLTEDTAPPPAATEASPPPLAEVSSTVILESTDEGGDMAAPPSDLAPDPDFADLDAPDPLIEQMAANWLPTPYKPFAPLEVDEAGFFGNVGPVPEEKQEVAAEAVAAAEADVIEPAPEPQVGTDATARDQAKIAGAWARLFRDNPEVYEHMKSLPSSKIWTFAMDCELANLQQASWSKTEIALQLKVQGEEVRKRLDELCGSKKVSGTPQKKFTVDRVCRALDAAWFTMESQF